jgi:alanine racemase
VRPTEARIHLGAIRSNVENLRALAGGADLCAVVKADAYGHGAEIVAPAMVSAGASWLAVATLEEAIALLEGGTAGKVPVLVLSELDPDELPAAISDFDSEIRLTVGSMAGASALLDSLSVLPDGRGPVRVHMKIDTGMHRVGIEPREAVMLADRLMASPAVEIEGIWTHLAVADDPDDPFTAEQLDRFDRALAELAGGGHRARLIHAANSAGLIAHPDSRRDLVRAGIAMYGVHPDPRLAETVALEPALSLVSRVRAVRTVEPGEGVSYGRRWRAGAATHVATVPIGYADGVRRDSAAAGVELLVRGQRRALLGVVTMDQLMIEVDDAVDVGDEVVLIGSQGSDHVSADEIALKLGTIPYEILTSIGGRVPRRVID